MKTTRHCKGGPFAVQGRTQMPMESNRFRSSPRKRSSVKNENDASDVAILNVAFDSDQCFGAEFRARYLARETERLMTFSILCFPKQIESSPTSCRTYGQKLAARRLVTPEVSR